MYPFASVELLLVDKIFPRNVLFNVYSNKPRYNRIAFGSVIDLFEISDEKKNESSGSKLNTRKTQKNVRMFYSNVCTNSEES